MTKIETALPPRIDYASRLARRYQPGFWIGGWRKVFGPLAEASDEHASLVDHHPPHFLVALWQPVSLEAPIVPRWPYKATLVAPDEGSAMRELFHDVSDLGSIWLANEHIDWALVAEIVMVGERWLQPFHYRELQGFVRMERASDMALIAMHYGSDASQEHTGFSRTRPQALTT